MEEKVFVAWNLAGLGAARLYLGNPKHAVRLFGATETIFEKFGGQLDDIDQDRYEYYRTYAGSIEIEG